jgi:cytoskeletal protein CcmA (bactofilin family)
MLTNQPKTTVPDSFPPPGSRLPIAPSSVPAARSAIVRNSSCIGPGLKIKDEIAGYEDLQIDGNVEGTIGLPGQKLTVGRSGELSCNVNAREVLVYGKVVGNLRASDLIDIKRDASVIGDIRAARISIEDGAYFKGYSDMEHPHVPTPASRTPIVPTDGATN